MSYHVKIIFQNEGQIYPSNVTHNAEFFDSSRGLSTTTHAEEITIEFELNRWSMSSTNSIALALLPENYLKIGLQLDRRGQQTLFLLKHGCM